MQNDNDLFELMKETYQINPRPEFVISTERMLRQHARKIEKKRNIIRISLFSSSFLFVALAMSWIFLFSGKEVIFNSLNSLGEDRPLSYEEEKEPTIYIYQSHNWESFLPEINGKDINEAYDDTKNITLVGERLSQALKERNIYAIHDKTNIKEVLKQKGLTVADSYEVSREPLIETLENEKSINMIFDLHRDFKRRNDTTVNIDGKDFAKIAIVISRTSSNYEENKKFATLIHQKLEDKYPGLSKGVTEKGENPKNTYNQDLLEKSLLLDIGGVDNTLNETFRTVDAFAEVIKEVANSNN